MIPKILEFDAELVSDGYFIYRESIRFELDDHTDELLKNFTLERMGKGKVLALNSILFKQATAVVRGGSSPFIEDLLNFLLNNPNLKIELMGHTDSQGSAKNYLRLSEARVERIQSYLIETNVNSGRIRARGYGETRPLAPNDTEENRMKNRRVEIKILDY